MLLTQVNRIQNAHSLAFTADGTGGDNIVIPIPPAVHFAGHLVGSIFYRIDNTNPPIGDTQLALIDSVPNTVTVGIEYDGVNAGNFYADLNGFRFETGAIFDADNYDQWMHFAFYINWQTPADSLLYWNNAPQTFIQVPAPNSTEFTPNSSILPIANIVSGTEIAQIYLAPASPDTTSGNFAETVLKRFSNELSPHSLGRKGGFAQGNRSSVKTLPWLYISLYNKLIGGDPAVPRNDVNDGALDFGTFTDFLINTNANVVLPP